MTHVHLSRTTFTNRKLISFTLAPCNTDNMADQAQFETLLQSLMSADNQARTQAEVKKSLLIIIVYKYEKFRRDSVYDIRDIKVWLGWMKNMARNPVSRHVWASLALVPRVPDLHRKLWFRSGKPGCVLLHTQAKSIFCWLLTGLSRSSWSGQKVDLTFQFEIIKSTLSLFEP